MRGTMPRNHRQFILFVANSHTGSGPSAGMGSSQSPVSSLLGIGIILSILPSCPKQTEPRNGIGAARSSSPWERPWNGDEDVATPFHAGPCEMYPHTGSSRHFTVGVLLGIGIAIGIGIESFSPLRSMIPIPIPMRAARPTDRVPPQSRTSPLDLGTLHQYSSQTHE